MLIDDFRKKSVPPKDRDCSPLGEDQRLPKSWSRHGLSVSYASK
jgi:hypothetical protein